MKVVLGICSPLEIACFAIIIEVVAKVRVDSPTLKTEEFRPKADRGAAEFRINVGADCERDGERRAEEVVMSLLVAGMTEREEEGKAVARKAGRWVTTSLLTIFAIV